MLGIFLSEFRAWFNATLLEAHAVSMRIIGMFMEGRSEAIIELKWS
jgi:hypothetical protein